MSPLNETKFIMLMGESWNLKAFLSLITDELKYDYIPPSSLLLLEAYTDGTLQLSVNDHKITKLKGTQGLPQNMTVYNLMKVLTTSQQVIMDKEMYDVCNY